MRLCDICRKETEKLTTIRIGTGIASYTYELCHKCKRKTEKYIKFEQARHSKKERESNGE